MVKLVQGRKRREDPAQEELVSKKDVLNQRIKQLIGLLIETKRGYNGRPAPGIGISEKGDIKNPLPPEVQQAAATIDSLSDNVVSELQDVIRYQEHYSSGRRKSQDETADINDSRWGSYSVGEWWLTDSGSEFADTNIGDVGHEQVAVDYLFDADKAIEAAREKLEELSEDSEEYEDLEHLISEMEEYSSNDYGSSSVYFNVTIPREIGIQAVDSPEIWDELERDPITAFMKYKNAVRVISNNFTSWVITKDVLDRIQGFIYENVADEDLENDVTIEQVSPHKFKTHRLIDILDMKNPGDVWKESFISKEASYVSRIWTHIMAPFQFGDKERWIRLRMLRAAAKMDQYLIDVESKVVSRSKNSIPDAVYKTKDIFHAVHTGFDPIFSELKKTINTSIQQLKELKEQAKAAKVLQDKQDKESAKEARKAERESGKPERETGKSENQTELLKPISPDEISNQTDPTKTIIESLYLIHGSVKMFKNFVKNKSDVRFADRIKQLSGLLSLALSKRDNFEQFFESYVNVYDIYADLLYRVETRAQIAAGAEPTEEEDKEDVEPAKPPVNSIVSLDDIVNVYGDDGEFGKELGADSTAAIRRSIALIQKTVPTLKSFQDVGVGKYNEEIKKLNLLIATSSKSMLAKELFDIYARMLESYQYLINEAGKRATITKGAASLPERWVRRKLLETFPTRDAIVRLPLAEEIIQTRTSLRQFMSDLETFNKPIQELMFSLENFMAHLSKSLKLLSELADMHNNEAKINRYSLRDVGEKPILEIISGKDMSDLRMFSSFVIRIYEDIIALPEILKQIDAFRKALGIGSGQGDESEQGLEDD